MTEHDAAPDPPSSDRITVGLIRKVRDAREARDEDGTERQDWAMSNEQSDVCDGCGRERKHCRCGEGPCHL